MSSILAIKLNFVALYTAITCVTPYLSCYLVAYTSATSSDVGKLKLVSSFIGMPTGLVLCNFADRYRAHRAVYAFLVFATLLGFCTMLGPMYWDQADPDYLPGLAMTSTDSSATTSTLLNDDDSLTTESINETLLHNDDDYGDNDGQAISSISDSSQGTNASYSAIIAENEDSQTTTTAQLVAAGQDLGERGSPNCYNQQQADVTTTKPQVIRGTGNPRKSDLWFYIVSVGVTVGTIASATSMNLLSSFAANIAAKCNTAYGIIRMWGAVGRICAAIMLSFINGIPSMLFLMPAMITFVVWATINLLLALFWPSNKPFDLSEKTSLEQSQFNNRGPKFKFAQRKGGLLFGGQRVVANCRNDLECGSKTDDSFSSANKKNKKQPQVVVTKACLMNPFDTREEDMFRNIRRCSLAPLGDSYVLKQFELDEKSGHHFKHVTKLEPCERDSGNSLPQLAVEYCIDAPKKGGKLAPPNGIDLARLARRKSSLGPGDKKIDIWLHLRILRMMIERNTDFIRFLFLIGAIGFAAAMNWLYLFPFIKKINPDKFNALSAYTMIAGYITEALFYLVSPWFSRNFGYSASLSWILIIYGARYLMYLVFTLQSNLFPLELLIVVESLRPLNMGWLNCVYNESALDFALKARECVPELIKLGFIDDTEEAIVRVTNGFKATIVGIMSCCFDGIGVAFGALFGGYIVDAYGFETLWTFSAAFSITCGLANFLFHLKCCEQPANRGRSNSISSLNQCNQMQAKSENTSNDVPPPFKQALESPLAKTT